MSPSPAGRSSSGGLALSILVACGFAWLYWLALAERHAGFRTFTFDLGLLAQVSWNSAHGRLFATSVMPFNYLAEHLSPVLLLLGPAVRLWDDPRVLLAVQAIAVAAAGPPLYLAARRRIGDGAAALLIQTAYHMAPATGSVARDEFHPIALAMAPIAAATALLWASRPRAAAAVAALALLAKEDAVFWVAPFGLWIALMGRRALGLGLTAFAVGWLTAYMALVVPVVRPAELGTTVPHPNIGAFSECGRTVAEAVACLMRDPAATAARLAEAEDLEALAYVLGPTAGLGALGPSALVAAPRWALLLLGDDSSGIRAHYAAVMAIGAYLAAAEAIGFIALHRRRAARAAGGALFGATAAAFALVGPLPGGGAYEPPDLARAPLMRRAVDAVASPEASVVATSSLLPHVALRERVFLLYDPPDAPPDYRIFDLRDAYPFDGDTLRARVAYQRSDPSYRIVLDEADVVVMRREREGPEVVLDERFGELVELNGVTVEPRRSHVRVSMFWTLLGATRTPHHFFVHLLDARGNGVGQADGALVGGRLSSTEFRPGVEIREVVEVPSERARPGTPHELRIGWYELKTGERIAVSRGADHVSLPVTVE